MSIPTKKLHSDFIEEVNQRTDLVDIISGHIELKKRGKEYLGLCPFHNEKSPSFSVSPTKKLAYCFGCSWGGNAVKFLMELNRVGFADAVLDLARSANIPVRYEDGSTEYDYPDPLRRPLTPKPLPAKEEKENSDKKDYTVDEWRVSQSVERLLSGIGDAAKALGWLFNRGITREMVER
ncbi:MAG: CHC2 zinc finger domain-containing protein, partial [Cyanobacteriota bacterium]|nr:CHC2 zinc finger domain-containing protein [Cyanobacteriota bacterium]